MPYLPTVPARGMSEQRTVTFRGVRRHDRIREGEWSSAENLTSDRAPMLAVRAPRSRAWRYGGTVLALVPSDPPAALLRPENAPDLVLLQVGSAIESFDCPRSRDPGGIVRMGALLVLPGLDAVYNTVTGARESLSAAFAVSDTDLSGGEGLPCVVRLCPCDAEGNELRVQMLLSAEAGDALEANDSQNEVDPGECYAVGSERRIRRFRADPDDPEPWVTMPHYLRVEAAGIDESGLRPGDSVQVSGLPFVWAEGVAVDDVAWGTPDPGMILTHNRNGSFDDDPNGLREIAAVGAGFVVLKDVFFTRRLTADASAAQGASVSRGLPELDFVVEAQNRLWGCRYGGGVNELYASALGDPTAWQRFSGLSTASWTASVGSAGKFTGAGVLDGCPVFFKEHCVHRVWPSAAGAHRVTEQALPGVAPGCAGSVTPFEGGLAYLSHAGVVRWSGGAVTVLSEALGPLLAAEAAAGVQERKLYLALRDPEGGEALWVYDAAHETWFSESVPPEGLPRCFLQRHGRLCAAADSVVWDLTGQEGEPEDPVRFSCTSGLIGYTVTQQKYVSRLEVRLTLPRGSSMDVWLEYDSDGVWHHGGHLRGQGTGSFLLPVRPRRCDHFRIRLTGEGDARIFSLVKHIVKGSDLP